MATITLGTGGLVTPNVQKMTTANSYLDLRTSGWAQQYLPELYEAEVEKYGDRSISGFIKMLGAEMPMASDQVIWSEQGRLHLAYEGEVNGTAAAGENVIDAITDIDGGGTVAHAIRKDSTIVAVVNGLVFKALVTKGIESTDTGYKDGTKLNIKPYGAATISDLGSAITTADNQAIKFFVYGSEFGKGTGKMNGSVEPKFLSLSNQPMIIKDHFEINGSDTAQIGWVEVSGESGQSGYLWYLKSQGDTTKRYEDYLEMVMVEAEKANSNSTVGVAGSEGLLSAIGSRGMVSADFFDPGAAADINDFDDLIVKLDEQGAISENMLFLNRASNLQIDDLLAGLNPHSTGGLNFGAFNNSEDMALNLGFNGFNRGGYEFYKTDWKYLNNKSTRGNVGGLRGVLVPAGTSSVYDQSLGKNVRRPFLHVRYRASEADDRKLKTWVTGSVGGASSSDLDKMEVHYLSERCLVVQAANNFVRFDD